MVYHVQPKLTVCLQLRELGMRLVLGSAYCVALGSCLALPDLWMCDFLVGTAREMVLAGV